MSKTDELLASMSVTELEEIIRKSAEMAEALRQREQLVSETRATVEKIIVDADVTIEELYPNSFHLQDVVGSSSEKRQLGTPKFIKDGIVYDGRQARRSTAFEDYVENNSLNMDKVIADGLINPLWLDEQSLHKLETMGIDDLTAYKEKHGM